MQYLYHLKSFVPKHRYETPGEARARDPDGHAKGKHLSPQQCAAIIQAIMGGKHTTNAIVSACEDMPELDLNARRVVDLRLGRLR